MAKRCSTMTEEKKFYREVSFLKFLLPGGRVMVLIMLVLFLYTCFALWWDEQLFPAKKLTEVTSGLFSSAAMGLLLVFRINSAYDRWWEGRKLWGQLVNDMRNMCIKLKCFLPAEEPRFQKIIALLSQFPQILRDHLRERMDARGRRKEGTEAHKPLQCSREIYENLVELKKGGQLDGFAMLQIDSHAHGLMDICGACERIIKSPISGSFKLMIWACISLYLLMLPWLLIPVFDLWAFLLVLISAYFVLGIELLAEDIERPFGLSPNDIPLEAICATIEQSLQEIFAEDPAGAQAKSHLE